MITWESRDSSPLVCLHRTPKSQLWSIILVVMHTLQLRPAQCLRCFACLFYEHNVQYGFASAAIQGWKRKWDIGTSAEIITIGNKNISVYSKACSRKCTTQKRSGRRWINGWWWVVGGGGGLREAHGREAGGNLLMKKLRRWEAAWLVHFAAAHPEPRELQYLHVCMRKVKSVSCLLVCICNFAFAVLSDHQIAFVAFGNRINTPAGSPLTLGSLVYTCHFQKKTKIFPAVSLSLFSIFFLIFSDYLLASV